MFPQRCSRLLWNIEECMNVEEYMFNVEELIYFSTFLYSTMFHQHRSRLFCNIEECMKLEEYCGMWKNLNIIPVYFFSMCFHNFVLDFCEILKNL